MLPVLDTLNAASAVPLTVKVNNPVSVFPISTDKVELFALFTLPLKVKYPSVPYFPASTLSFLSNFDTTLSVAASNTYCPSVLCTTGTAVSAACTTASSVIFFAEFDAIWFTLPTFSVISAFPSETASLTCSTTGSVSCTCSTVTSSACADRGLIPIPDSTMAPARSNAISRFLSFLPLLPNIPIPPLSMCYKRLHL